MRWLLMLVAVLLSSQTIFPLDYKKVSFGFKTGMVISSFWGNGIDSFEKNLSEQVPDFDPDMLLSASFCGFADYEVIPSFFNIQGELRYLRLGKKWEFDLQNGESASFNIYTDYLLIPVLFKLLIPQQSSSVLSFVYAGPALFLQLRSRANNLSTVASIDQREFLLGLGTRHNISNQVSNFDFGFETGLGFNFAIRPGAIVLDFRFGFGTINTFNTDGGEEIRNNSFAIMVGYLFR